MNDALCVAEAVDFPFMGFASSAQYTDNFPPHLEPHAFALNLTTNTVFVCGTKREREREEILAEEEEKKPCHSLHSF